MSIASRDQRVIWHPYTQMRTAAKPIGIVRGDGLYLFDEDGKRYLDMISSWWVNIHGHAHPHIAQQVAEQLQTLEHVIFAGFTHQGAVSLGERLLAILPANQKRIFYTDNGSTAVEVALKMALQYWHNKDEERHKILAFNHGYHGDTFGAMAVSGRGVFTSPFFPFLFHVDFIEPPLPGKEEESLSQLYDHIERGDPIAAFIFEPLVQGTGGMLMQNAKALDKMIDIAQKNNIITIADEVMTGFGRTGKMFATDYLEHKTDIMCLSKGLTGGTMPLGVTSCSEDIYSAFLSDDRTKALFHGHSYTANPLACAAALASLDILQTEECFYRILEISKMHEAFLEEIVGHVSVQAVRVLGTILAIEIKTSDKSSYFNNMRDFIYNFFIDRGIILRPLGNIIYLIPPYCTEKEDLQYTYAAIVELLEEMKQ